MVIIFVFSTSNYTLWNKKKNGVALEPKRPVILAILMAILVKQPYLFSLIEPVATNFNCFVCSLNYLKYFINW